jgi:hypothetical protein
MTSEEATVVANDATENLAGSTKEFFDPITGEKLSKSYV